MDDPTWEYTEFKSFDGEDESRRLVLAALGADKWEMVSAIFKPTGTGSFIFFFKRRLKR